MFTRLFTPALIAKHFIHRSSTTVRKGRVSPTEFLWNMIQDKNVKSVQDWKDLRTEILNANGPVTESNIDAMTVGVCTNLQRFDLALSYLDFLKKENIKANLATIGKYFRLLYLKNVDRKLDQCDEERILSLYEHVRKTYPFLDGVTLENIVQPLSLTTQWRTCVELLEEIKVTACPSSTSYSVLIAAAFLNNADALAWKLLMEMIDNDKPIQPVIYTSYFKRALNCSNYVSEIEKLFSFMQSNGIKVESAGVREFVESLKQRNTLKISPSVVTPRGVCKHCNQKLRSFDLTHEEFNDLKEKVAENVIMGKDVFNKTTPEELRRFKDFIKNVDQFNVVIDGLNVAYSAGVQQPLSVTSGLVAAVVSHFVNLGKKVLVFGRNHMARWPKQNWMYIQQNAEVFLTQDLSQDDPYLLYSALNCGKDTIIVSRDLMRGHKFLLKNVHLKLLFDKWLSQRQYVLLRVVGNGNVVFRQPLSYSHIAQKNGDCWHIPCTSPSKVPSADTHWLCIKL